jgi:hypothetical protein
VSNQLTEDEVMRRLAQYRPLMPTDEWDTAARSAALAVAVDEEQADRVRYKAGNRRHRWLAVAGGIAAAGAAVLVVALLPSGNAHAPSGSHHISRQPTTSAPLPTAPPVSGGPVERLAAAARHTTLDNPQAGQYWYQRVDEYAVAKTGTSPKRLGTIVNWVAPNGDDWVATKEGSRRSCTFYKYVGTPTINHPNAKYLQDLPTHAGPLYRLLRAQVTGSNSKTEAVFVAISDALHNDEGLVPPNLRAAFIEVLGRLPHVTVRPGVVYGDGATATTFSFSGAGSLWFDEGTAQLVYRYGAPGYRVAAALPRHIADPNECPRGSN